MFRLYDEVYNKMMQTYFCRGLKKNGEECGAVVFKADLTEGVVMVVCHQSVCGHHRNTVGVHSNLTVPQK